ncbi:tRNA-dihydrouridine synthase [Photobacterium damselae subsp. piscicida]|nr:tRNA-dihydrouridine synthase [Photobacterium damselae subsp. piscicida]
MQILGQDPNWMAENGRRAVELGSPGVDINFGCPAKLVNKSKGGAVLLKEPELIHQIVKSVRQAVDPTKPVTAKIRLGWDDPNHCFEIADAIAQAGADEITVHGRTKEDGYRAEEISGITFINYNNTVLSQLLPMVKCGTIKTANSVSPLLAPNL